MKEPSIKVNAVLNIVVNISNILIPLLIFPFVSRVIGADGLGRVSLFTNVSTYAMLLGSLGIQTYGVRTVASVRNNPEMLQQRSSELFSINLLFSAVVAGLLLSSGLFVQRFKEEPMLLSIIGVEVALSPFGINWFYSGLEQYRYIVTRTIGIKLAMVIAVFLLVPTGGYLSYAAILIASNCISYVINYLHARRITSIRFTAGTNLKEHWKPMMFFFASALAVSIYISLDTIMLGFISGDRAVGLYTVASKTKSLLLIAVNSISTALLPRLSFYYSENRIEEYRQIIEKSVSVIMMISMPLVMFFMLEASDTILFLGGQEYFDAAPCMMIIMPILLISGISNITGNQILIPSHKENLFLKAVSLGALTDVIFNALLMPSYGCVGAAVATLVAEIVQMSIQFYYSREYMIKALRRKNNLLITFSCLISLAIGLLGREFVQMKPVLNILFSGIIFLGTYLVMLILFKVEAMSDFVVAMKKRICR